MTRMPPQAYTKEVLASAFDWLSRQNESVKKSIRTSDDLVGLYLKSTRLNENQNLQKSSPTYSSDLSSAKSFRSELQGLAINLKQFEEKPEPKPKQNSEYLHELNLMMSAQAASSSRLNGDESTSQKENQNSPQYRAPSPHQELIPESQPSRPTPQNTQHYDEPPMPMLTKVHTNSPQSTDSAETVLLKLDKKTISAINIAKDRLNLSSNTEAIRVLVSLGEKHLKKVFGSED